LPVDSSSDLARIVTWHRALVTSDSAREAFWHGIGSASQKVTMFIILFIHGTGIGHVDVEKARAEDYLRLRAHEPGICAFAFSLQALNAGRPDDITPEPPGSGHTGNGFHRVRIQRALSWDADTLAALESMRILGRSIAAPASGEGARQQLFDICTVGEWKASRGDYAGVEKAVARLRQARYRFDHDDAGKTTRHVRSARQLLEAMRASGLRLPGAREKVAVADSLAREYIFAVCCGERLSDANIQIARLWEREGRSPGGTARHRTTVRAVPLGPAVHVDVAARGGSACRTHR
jgi:hypothetical protein